MSVEAGMVQTAKCTVCKQFHGLRDIGLLSATKQKICKRCLEDAQRSLGFLDRSPRFPSQAGVTSTVRLQVLERDAYRCRYCAGFAGHLCIDHVLPQSRGGEHTPDNLVTACKPCNSRKRNRTPEEAGMVLRPLDGAA
jgi:5-methylcytosine-specific restriction endonuclease McrA